VTKGISSTSFITRKVPKIHSSIAYYRIDISFHFLHLAKLSKPPIVYICIYETPHRRDAAETSQDIDSFIKLIHESISASSFFIAVMLHVEVTGSLFKGMYFLSITNLQNCELFFNRPAKPPTFLP
jgi:hypothetical protein